MSNKNFKRHFRIYFKNNHPAYIVDEEGNLYVFHRITHSRSSGRRADQEIINPLLYSSDKKPSYMVKKSEKDKKGRFSLFELDLKPGIDINHLEIKKAGGSQTSQNDSGVVNNISTSVRNDKRLNHKGNQAFYHKGFVPPNIKTNMRRKRKRNHGKHKLL